MDRFETFTALVTGISRTIRKIKNEEMVEFHLKGPHVSCLYYLYKNETLTAKELSELCEEDKANMSRTVEYLIKGGYIAKRTACRYRAPLSLTEEGKRIGAHIAERIDRVLFAGLTKKNLRRGDWRYLTDKEISMLRMGAYE